MAEDLFVDARAAARFAKTKSAFVFVEGIMAQAEGTGGVGSKTKKARESGGSMYIAWRPG